MKPCGFQIKIANLNMVYQEKQNLKYINEKGKETSVIGVQSPISKDKLQMLDMNIIYTKYVGSKTHVLGVQSPR